MRVAAWMIGLALFCAPAATAQTLEQEVAAAVERLFDGMRAGDSTMVRSVFHPEARLMSAVVRDGRPALLESSIDGFVTAIGRPHDEVWDERIWNLDVQVDGSLATAWMNYAFYLGGQFSHCGVNAFQFVKGADGWQTIQITDTRRTDSCNEPP